METIKQVLMRRDSMSASDADALIAEARAELDALLETGNPSIDEAESIITEYFGLEPDYLMEILPL